MKTKLLVSLCLLGLTPAWAQQFNFEESHQNEFLLTHDFTELSAETVSINGQDYFDLGKTYKITTKDVGAPEVPMFSESVILPNKGAASLEIVNVDYIEYQNIEIAPSKGSLKRNIDPEAVPYTFGPTYSTDAFFPAQPAQLGDPYIFRSVRGATVRFTPYQYNPVTKVLRVCSSITTKITVDNTNQGINEIVTKGAGSKVANNIIQQHFINADQSKYNPLEEDGDLLIIVPDQYVNKIQPLADWKTQEGIETKVVTTSTAGSSDTQLKAYIESEYGSNPDLLYVLLVGDHSSVPSHTYGSSGWEQLWSDSYYGMINGNDYYPELFVGRLSGNPTQIETQVDRILEYEKYPASGDWMTRAIGLASDEGSGYGDDGEADWEHARNIRTKLMNYGYTTVHEFYDGSHGGGDASGNPTPGIISPAVNEGIGLFNYTGHGDENTCITGNFGSSDINAATNNGYYPFVISVACNNGTFTSGTCISEVWMNANNAGTPTGAISACGSTILMAWAEPMQTQDEMAEIISESYANNRKKTLGGLFYNSQMSMLEEYSSSGTAVEVMQTWVMFGDPTTMFRNQTTTDLTAQHLWNVPLGTTNLEVQCATDGALVAIVQDGVILGKAEVSGGMANVTFPALTSEQPLIVTVTKQNYKPYQASVQVGNGPLGLDDLLVESVAVYPNPSTDFVNVAWDEQLNVTNISLKDVFGRTLISQDAPAAGLQLTTSELPAGMYFVEVVTNAQRISKRLIIK